MPSELKPCRLDECPPGLFMFGETLGFRSEYTTVLEDPRRYQPDAYCVESGEYFWGGAANSAERSALIVQPIDARPEPATPAGDDALVEELARVIDPSSWVVMDSYLAQMLRKYKGENAAYDPDQYKHKESMAKARAILPILHRCEAAAHAAGEAKGRADERAEVVALIERNLMSPQRYLDATERGQHGSKGDE